MSVYYLMNHLRVLHRFQSEIVQYNDILFHAIGEIL